jgi:predicted DNA-binding WGR domain protein
VEIRRLYFREGKSDKVYVATLDGGSVTFAWGRRGASMQTKTFGPFPHGDAAYGEARQLWTRKIQDKLDKGYREFDPAAAPWGIHKLPMAQPVIQPILTQVNKLAPVRKPPAPATPAPARQFIATPGTRKFRFDDE